MNEEELNQLRQTVRKCEAETTQLTEIALQQARHIQWLIANVQALSAINHGVFAALHSNPAFIEKLTYAAKHRDARFNASTMADESIAAFKTNLRELLPDQLKHLVD